MGTFTRLISSTKRLGMMMVAMCLALYANAQVASYIFSQSTSTYTPLASPTALFTTGWDDNQNNFTLPFTFTFNGVANTTVRISSNGAVTFGTNPGTTNYGVISSATGYTGAIAAFSRDLINNGLTLSTGTEGTSPNRVFVIQWNNARRYSLGAITGDVLNFQIRLYETSNIAEVRYGTCTATNTTAYTCQVGLRGSSNTDFNNRNSTTSWAATTAGVANGATVTTSNTIMPASGLTFTWTPPPPPTCLAPTALTATGITGSSANIGWTPAGIATQWDIYYSTSNTAPTGLTTPTVNNTTSNPHTISGLNGATTYYVWVRSDCGAGDVSTWTALPSFNTLLLNDDCSGAITLGAACAGSPVTGSTIGSSVDAIYTDCGSGGSNTTERGVWYKYVGDNNNVTITTCDPLGTGYDTRLTVYSGSCGAFTCVTANDDMTPGCATGSFRSKVTFDAFAGTDYYIFVHGYQLNPALSATGAFKLTITCSALCTPIVTNETCGAATSLTPAANTCVTPVSGNNTCAADNFVVNPACFSLFATLPDVWYSFVAPATPAKLTINYGSATSLGFVTFDGCGGTELQCQAVATSGTAYNLTGLTPGLTYYVAVLGPDGNAGSFDVCVSYETCPSPSALASSNVTTNTANISWTTNGTPVVHEIYYGVSPYTAPTGLSVPNDTATSVKTLTGLSSSTSYDVWVRAYCGGSDYSAWVGPITFGTSLDCATAPALSCGTPVTAVFSGAGAWDVLACGFSTPGAEKVYQFTATTSGNHTLTVNSATGGYVDYFWKDASGTCDATGWTCIDDLNASSSVSFGPLTAGTTYYLLADPEGTSARTHSYQIDCPVDPCTAITALSCNTPSTHSITSGGGQFDFSGINPNNSCGFSTPGGEKIWSFTAPSTGTYTFNITNVAGTDYVDYLWKDAANGGCSGTGWSCLQDINGNASFALSMQAGVTYLFLGDRELFLGDVATKTVTVSITCPKEWNGVTTDWFDANNWVPAGAPVCGTNVHIAAGGNQPIIAGAPASVGGVSIDNNASIELQGQTLTVCGDWNAGTGSGAATIGSGEVIMNSATFTLLRISGNTNFVNLTIDEANVNLENIGGAPSVGISGGLHLQSGVLNTSAGTLTILSPSPVQAGYIDDFTGGFTGAIQGPVTVQRGVGVPGSNQHFASSPVDNGGVQDFIPGAGGADNVYVTPWGYCDQTALATTSNYGSIFEWDENGPLSYGCYQANWKVRSSGNLTNGEGYSSYLNGGTFFDLTGAANSGAIARSGLGNSGYSSTSMQGQTVTSGWHMMGNPYPSPIILDASHVISEGFDAQAQIWVTSGPYSGTWNPELIGTPAAQVAMGQGFQVHNSNLGVPQTFTFNNSERVRTSTANPAFYQMPNSSSLQVDVTNGSGYKDRTRVYFNDDATPGFDQQYDASKFMSAPGIPTIYTTMPNYNEWVGINTLRSINETSTVPMGFKVDANGNYTFSFTGINTFDPTSYIYLEDLQTGTMHNARSGDYSFTANATDAAARFVLHFTPAAEIAATASSCSNDGSIVIAQPGSAVWNYSVTNTQGTILSSGVVNQTTPATVNNLSAGVYTLTLADNNGYTVVKNIQVTGSANVAASFIAPATATVGQDVTFNNTTTDAVNYEWNMGDGTIISGIANPSYSYSTPGQYTVTLTVVNANGCSNTISQMVTVGAATGIANVGEGTLNIYGNGNKVYVDFSKLKGVEATIEIYNVIGQNLSTEKFGKSTIYAREIKNLDAAYVIVKVINNGETITKKVFVANSK
jgi:hypothetical protein